MAVVSKGLFSVGLAAFLLASPSEAAPKPEDVPTCQLRARVVSAGGQALAGRKFTFNFGVGATTAPETDWSDWMKFDRAQVEANLKGYPAIYMKGWPVVTRLSVGDVADPTIVEAELKFDEGGDTVKMSAELFGPALGVLIWRDEAGKPHAATMAEYNHRYWESLEGVQITEAQRPKKFPIVERFIGGDDDRRDWQEGIEQLTRAGFSVIMLPPSSKIRDILLKTGLRRTAWAVYNPPGYAFDYDPSVTPAAIDAWAREQAKPYLDAGYDREDMAVFAMSDEPGWYFPSMFKPLVTNPAALARFRDYLKSQQLQPVDLGAKTWDEVQPLGRSQANDLPSKRLFYWTMRFYAWDSARHFAVSTRALESAFYPGLPVLTNWNFFSGRFYVPGPVANNADKQSPDAAMGGHDWLEFGRMRGCTMLWTEDWFSDAQAYQWSFYCAKLRCAAEKGGVEFGAYVIPRTAGDRADGILQKILCVVGSGGKCIKYFVFGPEYNFPGNCYSERAQVLPKMAEAHRMIGAAEDLLWEGRRPRPEVAILMPRSAQAWDARNIPIPDQIEDATNTDLNRKTVDYMAEIFDLYLALQHANISVDFVDDDDLSLAELNSYRVLYVTAPDIPAEGQEGLIKWVRRGGTLVTVSGAGAFDRYHEPCEVFGSFRRFIERSRERLLVPSLDALTFAGRGRGCLGEFMAIGPRSVLGENLRAECVEAVFDDGSPAVLQRRIGGGRLIHFTWMPGLSYVKSSNATKDRLPVGFSDSIRRWIASPVEAAGVQPPVSVDSPMVETPLLLSPKGAVVTLLNWSGESAKPLTLRAHLPFAAKQVESVRHGSLAFWQEGGDTICSLPLEAADFVLYR